MSKAKLVVKAVTEPKAPSPVELNAVGRRHAAVGRGPGHQGEKVVVLEVKPANPSKAKTGPIERPCLECGKPFTPIYAPHGLYCWGCSGHKHPATVITETRICKSCKAEFVPEGHDAWQVTRCPSCRAKRLERAHARKALVVKVVV